MALAAAIGLEQGDEVQWELLDRRELHLVILKNAPISAKSKAQKSPASPIIPARFSRSGNFRGPC